MEFRRAEASRSRGTYWGPKNRPSRPPPSGTPGQLENPLIPGSPSRQGHYDFENTMTIWKTP